MERSQYELQNIESLDEDIKVKGNAISSLLDFFIG